jgi:hypothetical protein
MRNQQEAHRGMVSSHDIACLPVCLSACLPVCLSACRYLTGEASAAWESLLGQRLGQFHADMTAMQGKFMEVVMPPGETQIGARGRCSAVNVVVLLD